MGRSKTHARSTLDLRLGGVLLLALAALGSACAPRPHADWPETKDWVRRSFPAAPTLTVDELARTLADPSAPQPLLLDARAEEEWGVSHLDGALLAPDADAALAVLEGRPLDTPVVVYCSVGYRSGALTEELRERGYTDVRNLEGSIFEWANRGLPVVRDGSEVDEVHPYDEEWGRLLEARYWPPD